MAHTRRMSSLHGKVALVTGAASGIGAGTARALAARGVRLVLLDVAAEPLATVADELGALGVVADVRDLDAVQAAVGAGVERFGGIDLVLANAGIASYGSVLAVDPEDFKRVLEVNVLGVFHTVRAALPSVLERRGYILVVSSAAAFVPAGNAPYDASKAGVEHFANTLRVEVAAQGVAVGCAHMSWIDTPMLRRLEVGLPAFVRLLAALPSPLRPHVPGDRPARMHLSSHSNDGGPRYTCHGGSGDRVASARPDDSRRCAAANRIAAEYLPQIDADVAALGRTTAPATPSSTAPVRRDRTPRRRYRRRRPGRHRRRLPPAAAAAGPQLRDPGEPRCQRRDVGSVPLPRDSLRHRHVQLRLPVQAVAARAGDRRRRDDPLLPARDCRRERHRPPHPISPPRRTDRLA